MYCAHAIALEILRHKWSNLRALGITVVHLPHYKVGCLSCNNNNSEAGFITETLYESEVQI